MYGDQFGEFVCGYWDLRVKVVSHTWLKEQGMFTPNIFLVRMQTILESD